MYKILTVLFVSSFMIACDEQGPAEEAGEKVDETMQQLGDEIDDASERMREAVDEVEEEIDQ